MLIRSLLLRAVVAVLMTGCAAATPVAHPVETDRCNAVESPPVQAGLHLIGDREPPVAYSSVPPTSGWHRSGVAGPGIADRPLSEPVQVGLLEQGLVVVTHGALEEDGQQRLVDAVGKFPERLAVTEYAQLAEGEVALAAWGALQRCDGVDPVALERFVEFYATTGDDRPHAESHP